MKYKLKMEEKYIKFYKTFHKKYKNNENLILCSKSLSDSRMILLGFYTSDPYDDEKYSALDGALGS